MNRDMKIMFIFAGCFVLFILLISEVSYYNMGEACEKEGLKFNGEKCYKIVEGRYETYQLENQSPYSLKYKVNKNPSVE